MSPAGLGEIVKQIRNWNKTGDVFPFIAGANARKPAAAQALIENQAEPQAVGWFLNHSTMAAMSRSKPPGM